MSADPPEGATVWLVVSAGYGSAEPGVYGAYVSEELAEQHRARLGAPEKFEVEWTVVRSLLDPILNEVPS